jgi:hypothetical protein
MERMKRSRYEELLKEHRNRAAGREIVVMGV